MRNSISLAVATFVAAGAVAGCGPGGPGSLEGFGDGDFGETEGPGDGDPGPGDGDPGDGDPDPDECIDVEFGDAPEIYFQDLLSEDASSDHLGACLPAPGPDYSIAWTAPASGPYRAILFADFFGELSILRGGCGGTSLDCAAEDVPQIIDFQANAGQDYTFVVDSAEEFGGYFEFSLFPVGGGMGECPEGELIGPADSVWGSTQGASNTFGSPCGGEESPDHGYIFVPPLTGTYHVDMFGSDYDTMLHVFEGECGGALVDCNDDSFELQSELFVFLEAGKIYTIVADGFGGDAGSYQLNIEPVDLPPSQLCDGAEDLGDTVPLLIEWPSDFDAGNLYQNCSPAPAELRLRWTAPTDGIYRVVQDAQPNFSALSVLEDGCFGQFGACVPADDQGAIYEFEAFAGQELLFISEWEPFPQTTVSLSLTEVTPAGPGCGQPMPMGAPSFASGNTLNGGDQYDGSCSSGPAPEDEYWWTAPATGTYRITLEGSNYDTLMFVRDGGCNGPELACNDDTFTDQGVSLWSSVELDLSVGQTISIFVDGYNGSGSYELAILPL